MGSKTIVIKNKGCSILPTAFFFTQKQNTMKYQYKNIAYNVELQSSTTDCNGRQFYKIEVEDWGTYYGYFSSLEFAKKQAELDIEKNIH